MGPKQQGATVKRARKTYGAAGGGGGAAGGGGGGGGAAGGGGGGGGAAPKVSQQERALARHAEVQQLIKIGRLKVLEQNKTIVNMATEREAYGSLCVMCKPTVWSSEWDCGKLVYDFVRGVVLDPNQEHMAVLTAIVDSQKALRKDWPVEEDWTLWEICLGLENRATNDMELWRRAMQEFDTMLGGWSDDLYDVEISPLFLYLQCEYDDESDKEDDEIMMEPEKWHKSDPEQFAIWNRMYIKHVLTGLGEKADRKSVREWDTRYDIKKNLHALKTILKM